MVPDRAPLWDLSLLGGQILGAFATSGRTFPPVSASASRPPGNFQRTLATSAPIKDWSLTGLKEKLIKISASGLVVMRSSGNRGSYVLIKKKTTIIARIGLLSPALKHRRPLSEIPALPMTPVCAIIELGK